MADLLGTGSGRPGIPRTVGDFTVAGVAARTTTADPTDADWGVVPPPDGTLAVDTVGLVVWMRAAGVWYPMAYLGS